MVIKGSTHEYPVVEFPSLADAIHRIGSPENTFALADKTLFSFPFARDFAAIDPARILKVEATEEQKSFENLGPLFVWLLENGFRRDCNLLVIGGGIVQDIGCFIASVLFRGVSWDLVPTTLLAQCDSCIGSKSSLNIERFKNQIGTFYPPRSVSIVFDLLNTLPPDAIRSGLGEIIKLHLLSSEADFEALRQSLRDPAPAPASLAPLVRRSLEIKKHYIEIDEFDRGPRNLLNYGHTFGHAYESATHYKIPHGIGVSLGIATATFVSEKIGLAPAGYFDEINAMLRPYYEPYERILAEADREALFSAVKLDKKNTRGALNCILTRGAGKMEKKKIDLETELKPLVVEFLQHIGNQ